MRLTGQEYGDGELFGKAKIQDRAKQATKENADQLKIRFKEQCWIQQE